MTADAGLPLPVAALEIVISVEGMLTVLTFPVEAFSARLPPTWQVWAASSPAGAMNSVSATAHPASERWS